MLYMLVTLFALWAIAWQLEQNRLWREHQKEQARMEERHQELLDAVEKIAKTSSE